MLEMLKGRYSFSPESKRYSAANHEHIKKREKGGKNCVFYSCFSKLDTSVHVCENETNTGCHHRTYKCCLISGDAEKPLHKNEIILKENKMCRWKINTCTSKDVCSFYVQKSNVFSPVRGVGLLKSGSHWNHWCSDFEKS